MFAFSTIPKRFLYPNQANRDAGIREAECEKAAMDVKYNTDTKIEDNSRAFKLQKANFDKEVNTAVSNNVQDELLRILRIRTAIAVNVSVLYQKKLPSWSESQVNPALHVNVNPNFLRPRRKPRRSWRTSCRLPKSSRRSGTRRFKFRCVKSWDDQ